MTTKSPVALLLVQLEEAFQRQAWHGPNLLGSIRGIDPSQARARPGPGRHNIWELIVHCAYWKYAVTRRLTGAARGSFPYRGSNWFVRDSGTEADLKRDIALLKQCHQALLNAAGRVRPAELAKRPPGSRQPREFMIRGAALHDVYHAGQIQLIRRLVG